MSEWRVAKGSSKGTVSQMAAKPAKRLEHGSQFDILKDVGEHVTAAPKAAKAAPKPAKATKKTASKKA